MNRAEIEKQALRLPVKDRAALLAVLHTSLAQDSRLSQAEPAELVALRAAVESRLEAAFEGEPQEWTDEDWAALLRGEYRYPPDPDSQAAPPGWKSPRLSPSQ
jgi:hypothetical protein